DRHNWHGSALSGGWVAGACLQAPRAPERPALGSRGRASIHSVIRPHRSGHATTPPAYRRLKHRSAPPADSRDAGRARDDGRGWTLAPDRDPSPGAAPLLARVGPATPTRPPRLPLAVCRPDRLSCCRTLFATG